MHDFVELAEIEREPKKTACANLLGFGILNAVLFVGAGVLALWAIATLAFLTWGFR
ncbi:MAG: hypothetical protein ABSD74_19700 [Rhizomicrobium sp.]|jgi:hypothetical protein